VTATAIRSATGHQPSPATTPSATVAHVGSSSLSGRTALVTGAGSPTGIGIATARLLATMGAHVWLTATTDRVHERAAELRADGHEVMTLRETVRGSTYARYVLREPLPARPAADYAPGELMELWGK